MATCICRARKCTTSISHVLLDPTLTPTQTDSVWLIKRHRFDGVIYYYETLHDRERRGHQFVGVFTH